MPPVVCFCCAVIQCLPVMMYVFCFCCDMIPDNNIGVEGVKALVPALNNLSQLRELTLDGE